MFKIVDRKHFDYCSSLQIKSATRVADNNWLCNTDKLTVLIKVVDGVLLIGASEIEYDAPNEMRIVGMVKGFIHKPVVNFQHIVIFLQWVIDDDYCWE